MSTQRIARADWGAVAAAFVEFFAEAGTVETDAQQASFRADATGLTIGSDGSSSSFMPLHAVELGWDGIEFDVDTFEVRIMGPSGTYTYVLPPDLRPG